MQHTPTARASGVSPRNTTRDREAALREILELISRSRDDGGPVLDAILRRAANLCDAHAAALVLGRKGDTHQTFAAGVSVDAATIALYDRGEVSMNPEISFAARAILTGKAIHVDDMADTDGYRNRVNHFVSVVEDTGVRTQLFVPLMTPEGGIGALIIFRTEVRPYSPDEIALVEAFAAQAVIAIENVRQFRELQTQLAREAATREVLEVISRSRDDDAPVFDILVRSAQVLCDAPISALILVEPNGKVLSLAAHCGYSDNAVALFRSGAMRLDAAQSYAAKAIVEGSVINLPDLAESDLYKAGSPIVRTMAEEVGIRSVMFVPLMSGGKAIGNFSLLRFDRRPFTDTHVELVRTFAAQAVIAIENVRQFRELQERLERERATADILEVISKSRDDDRPVFDLIAQSAARLCGAAVCTFWRVEDGMVHYCASHGLLGDDLEEVERTQSAPLADNTATGQVFKTRAVARIEDATAESYADHEWVRARGLKHLVGVPILVDDNVWGSISLMWQADRAPREADIQLVESFAAQAAIAIENVRQFRALEALNAELGERVNAQVGEIERMGRLKRFLPAAVADAVISSGSEQMLSSHRALLGVLFCDIRGFTAFCETAEPEETIEVLQTYHEEMGKLIEAHGAGVDHRMGDGIMVLFNDPLPCDDPAGDAVRLAMAMRARMAELCARWRKMGHRLGFGVGISLGYLTVGMVGSSGRYDYTASGTAVNLAQRLCGEAQDGEILISPRARLAIDGMYRVETRGERNLKGIREPVEIFCVTGTA